MGEICYTGGSIIIRGACHSGYRDVGGRWDFIGENHSEIIQWMVMSSHVLFGSFFQKSKTSFPSNSRSAVFFQRIWFLYPLFRILVD